MAKWLKMTKQTDIDDSSSGKKYLLGLGLFAVMLGWLYIAGLLAQLIIGYKAWLTAGAQLAAAPPPLPQTDVFSCLQALGYLPDGPLCLLGVFCAFLLFAVFLLWQAKAGSYADEDRQITYASAGAYGTAGFMSPKEMRAILNLDNPAQADGIILGKLGHKAVCLPAQTKMNRNIAVYGAPGSMKSRAFVRNMILQAVKRGESMILTDPKSEIYEDMGEYIRAHGYTVRVLNLVHLENSDGWDCLGEVRGDQLMAQLFCDTIIRNTTSAMAKSDRFWDNGEQNLLTALVLYVSLSYKPGQQTIAEVYNLICHKDDAALSALFSRLPVNHPARAPFELYAKGSESVRNGVITGLGSRLQVFQNELICQLTNHPDIDLELPGKEKCAYFCVTSDQDAAFDFLSSLFFSCLFIRLVRYADQNGGRCSVDVDFILDEFPNIGIIPDFNKKVSTVRSRGLNISIIFQNLAQMQNRYPNDTWQEILGGCDTQLFLGCTDPLTAKYISDRTGEITIEVASTQRQLSAYQVSHYTPQYRESVGLGRRKLMTMDEVLRMPLEKELLILRGQKVLMLDKYDYTLHPESKKLIKSKATDYLPHWRREQGISEDDAFPKTLEEDDFSWALEESDIVQTTIAPKDNAKTAPKAADKTQSLTNATDPPVAKPKATGYIRIE